MLTREGTGKGQSVKQSREQRTTACARQEKHVTQTAQAL